MRRDGIVAWVKRKTGPPTHTIDDASKLKAKEAEAAAIVVGYFKDLKVGQTRQAVYSLVGS